MASNLSLKIPRYEYKAQFYGGKGSSRLLYFANTNINRLTQVNFNVMIKINFNSFSGENFFSPLLSCIRLGRFCYSLLLLQNISNSSVYFCLFGY
jgi:hypothetical protein